MNDLSKLRAPGWRRVVGELNAQAPDDRTFLLRLLAVLAQASAARQGVLWSVSTGDEERGIEPEPRAVAIWPTLGDVAAPVNDAQVEHASETRSGARQAASRGTVELFGLDEDTQLYDGSHKGYLIAAPLPVGEATGSSRHVVTLLMDQRSRQALQTTAAMVELMCGYAHGHSARQALRRTRAAGQALDLATRLIAAINTAPNFKGASLQLVNDLCRQLAGDRVSLGWSWGVGRRGEGSVVRVVSMSDTELVDRRMALVQKIEAAMDECLDQDQPVLFPPPPERATREGEESDVLLAQAIVHSHRELGAGDARRKILSLPLRADEDVVGVVTVETSGEGRFDLSMIELLQSTLDLIAPVLRLRRSDDRNLALRAWDSVLKAGAWAVGSSHTAWKLAGAALTIAAIASVLVRVEYRIEAPVTLRAVEQRTVSVPFDGVVASVPDGIESGARVEAGAVLAEMDVTDLRLQALEASQKRTESMKRADAALTSGKLSEHKQALAQAEEAGAQLALAERLIDRGTIRAPIAGTIIEGDLRDVVGASVKLGQAIYVVAPLEEIRIIARVSDADISLITDDSGRPTTGDMATRAFPAQRFPFHVERIVPLASPDEDRRNAFEVRARVERGAGWMRPGMEGLAKFNTGRRSLLDIGTRRIRDTLRLWLWW